MFCSIMAIRRALRERFWLYHKPFELMAESANTVYNPVVGMCLATVTSPWLIGMWISEVSRPSKQRKTYYIAHKQMIFELSVLGATCWNALDRPRTSNVTLSRALQRDGIMYFACVSCPPFALTLTWVWQRDLYHTCGQPRTCRDTEPNVLLCRDIVSPSSQVLDPTNPPQSVLGLRHACRLSAAPPPSRARP
jgi:hypothetical protein